MGFDGKERARGAVLTKLGLAGLTTTAKVDIAEFHDEHVRRQTVAQRFTVDGLTVDVPAGVYHPEPDSSSEFFIRHMKALDAKEFAKALEMGAGSGIISLFMAARWRAEVTAADISANAVASIKRNAALNGLELEAIQSDLFANVVERNFDFIVFNEPLIDEEPKDSAEKYNLNDPGGKIVAAFLREGAGHIKPNGTILFGLCSNSAYEVLDEIGLKFKIVALEFGPTGFWRGLVTARL